MTSTERFFQDNDTLAIIGVAACQAGVAWLMSLMNLVYAPIPMFAAALLAGVLFRGRPRQASLGGAIAGLLGGGFAQWAFHAVRIKKVMSWYQLSGTEQIALSIAEMLLYASLLSFFAAFLSWGTNKETTAPSTSGPVPPAVKRHNQIDVPMFKADDNKPSSPSQPPNSSPRG